MTKHQKNTDQDDDWKGEHLIRGIRLDHKGGAITQKIKRSASIRKLKAVKK